MQPYGDEIGMRYVDGMTLVEGGYGRTGLGSPIQWDASLHVGFRSAPVPSNMTDTIKTSSYDFLIDFDSVKDRVTVRKRISVVTVRKGKFHMILPSEISIILLH